MFSNPRIEGVLHATGVHLSQLRSLMVSVMSCWPAVRPRRVSPEAVGLARAFRSRLEPTSRPPRSSAVMLSIRFPLAGVAGCRVPPPATGATPFASRRARSEPSLLRVLVRAIKVSPWLHLERRRKSIRAPFCESILRSLKLGRS